MNQNMAQVTHLCPAHCRYRTRLQWGVSISPLHRWKLLFPVSRGTGPWWSGLHGPCPIFLFPVHPPHGSDGVGGHWPQPQNTGWWCLISFPGGWAAWTCTAWTSSSTHAGPEPQSHRSTVMISWHRQQSPTQSSASSGDAERTGVVY